jgi:PAS domain S-box-containing protein
VLAAFFAASGVSLVTYYWFLKSTNTNTDLIDAVTGLQTRAVRVHAVLNRPQLEERHLGYLRSDLSSIKTTLRALDQGGFTVGRQVPPVYPELRTELDVLKRKWAELEQDLAGLAALTDPRTADSLPDTRLHPQINAFEAEIIALLKLLEVRRGQLRHRTFKLLIFLTCAAVALLLVSTIVINRRVLRPIEQLKTGTQAIQRGDFPHRVPVVSRDELGSLGESFNQMTAVVQRSMEELTQSVAELKAEIEERRRVEERLLQSEARLAQAQRIAQLGGWESDLITGDLWWSAETYRIFGLPEGSSVTYERFFDFIHPDDRSIVREAAARARSEGQPYWVEHRILLTDGTEKYVREQAELIRDEDDRPLRLVGTVQDISDYRQLEERLRQSQKLEAIGQLAGGIAHDFNNLLTIINGYGDMLLQRFESDEPRRQMLQEIISAGERAASLTQQLLAFSRRQVLKPGVVNLNQIVTGIENMLRRLIGEDVRLKISNDPNLGQVMADPSQLEQVIMNLAINARDAMPRGGIVSLETKNAILDRTYAANHFTVRPGPYVMLAVSDIGSGMDQATQSRIFEPFFTTKELGRGTGLGLAVVYGIVKQSGGYIWVYSEPDHGTTFKIYLPRVSGQPETERRIPVAAGAPFGSERILVVEDDAGVREFIRAVLSEQGYTVLAASGADEAFQLMQTETINLLLTDIVLPDMSGPQLAEQVQKRQPSIKLLFMSGYSETAISDRGLVAPDMRFLDKPFTPAELASKVREALDYPPTAAIESNL